MLKIPKGYFHDKTILVLICANFFMAALGTILILLRLGGSGNYLVQYRSNLGPLSQDTIGSVETFLIFIAGFVIISLVYLFLSIRTYEQQRTFSVTVLSQSLFLLILAVIVSDALLRAVN